MNHNLDDARLNDDARLTAYALGEMDETERAAFENELNNWEEGRQAVEEIRATAAWLSGELAKDAPLELAPSQRQAIEARATQALPSRRKRGRLLPVSRWMEYAIAAMLVMGVSAIATIQWMEAQTRARVAAAESEMRNQPTWIGSLFIDYDQYPQGASNAQPTPMQVAKVGTDEEVFTFGFYRQFDKGAGTGMGGPGKGQGGRPEESEVGVEFKDMTPPLLPGNGHDDDADLAGTQLSYSGQGSVRYFGQRKSGEIYVPKPGEKMPLDGLGAVQPPAPAEPQLQVVAGYATTLTPETEKHLKTLGYLGGPNSTAPKAGDIPSISSADGRWRYLDANVHGEVWMDDAPNDTSAESYEPITDNAFTATVKDPLSTFSIDVDTASYANVRRYLNSGSLPPPDAVRIEELLNYFDYDYAPPTDGQPFAAHTAVAACPWAPAHRLVRIGLKGKVIDKDQRPACNLVFLLDVSGSMSEENKLPLVKQSMRLLLDKLTPEDKVAIVTYAGNSGLALASTPCGQKDTICAAIDALQSGGSTNGASGIQLAYDTAAASFIQGGANRVVLATDGDFNVGVTSQPELLRLIEDKAKTGVFLSVLGFGMGNLKDSTLEMLADKGNGNYAYIDSMNEAVKVFSEQLLGTIYTIAKDVKIQIEFNPAAVGAFRLIGYENRILRSEDFDNDAKDAGEIGAGHTVTALYEIVPAGAELPLSARIDSGTGIRALRHVVKEGETLMSIAEAYNVTVKDLMEMSDIHNISLRPGQIVLVPEVTSATAAISAASVPQVESTNDTRLLTLKLRYKQPDEDTSKLMISIVRDEGQAFEQSSPDFKFAAAVAQFGMVLRNSPYKGTSSLDEALRLAQENTGEDKSGYRTEFASLVSKAKELLAGIEQK